MVAGANRCPPGWKVSRRHRHHPQAGTGDLGTCGRRRQQHRPDGHRSTAIALRKPQDAKRHRDVDAARDAFEYGVGAMSWGPWASRSNTGPPTGGPSRTWWRRWKRPQGHRGRGGRGQKLRRIAHHCWWPPVGPARSWSRPARTLADSGRRTVIASEPAATQPEPPHQRRRGAGGQRPGNTQPSGIDPLA